MIKDFFAPLAIKLFTGATVALLIALGAVMWRADAISADRDAEREARIAEGVRHEVTRASLDSLTLRMAEMVRDGELRAERLDEAMADVAEDTAPLRENLERFERGEIDITELEGL